MREILLVSRWFYPGGVSLLEWLVALVIAAFAAALATRLLSGRPKTGAAAAGMAFCAAGTILSAGMIVAEIVVFQFTVPPAVAAYAVLAAAFARLFSHFASPNPAPHHWMKSAAFVVFAFAYLFIYGAVPPIVELQADGLDPQGANQLGNLPGTLAITEFADYECPPCAVQDGIMDQLWVAYSDRITYSFRHFPKPRHPHALPAAVASQCAAESGAFWETKRLLFSNQNRLAEFLALPQLPTIPAREAERFAQCVRERSTHWIVDRDRQDATDLGLNVTPSILIGNKLIQGVVRYPRLALIVERELRDRGTPHPRPTSVRLPAGCSTTQACAQ